MKFPESWLREFVDPPIDNETLAYRLTMAGLEVEENEPVAPFFQQVVVGQILTVVPHENADRLRVCRVDVGEAAPLQIVCGAPNAKEGMKVPCAKVGAVLPGNFAIKTAQVRGIESFGMLCSARELGLSEDSSGLLALPFDAPVGQDFRHYYALDDRLLTLKLTPNRADCLSIYGVARDVGAITQTKLKAKPIPTVTPQLQEGLAITVEDQAACPRYCGRLIRGVNAAVSTPEWMKRKLERSGLRSLSAIVDITNYVLLELGQPLHAFDASTIQQSITVRWAKMGEMLTLLNEKEVILKSDMLVIADEEKPLALAGIMGGLASAVSQTTTDVFLESAFFAPFAIAGRPRRLGLSSDAAYRYERGVDIQLASTAIERATALILEICGGVAGPVSEVKTPSPFCPTVSVRLSKITTVLGVTIPEALVINYLTALGMAPVREGDTLTVTVPSYRFDIAIEEDVIEEVGRLYGYDQIPVRPVNTSLSILPLPGDQFTQAQIQAGLVARDYHEVINYAFVDTSWEQDFVGNSNPVRLQNPIASQMSVMRSSLLGGLIDCLRKNVNRQHERIRIFEVGRVFMQQADNIDQPEKLAGLAYGPRYPEQWSSLTEKVDFYDIKGDIEALLHPRSLRFEGLIHPALHPGRAAQVLYAGKVIGLLGELHPQWVQKYALPHAPIVFELSLTALKARGAIKATEFSRQPAVRRDLAFIVDDALPVQYLLDTLQAVPSALLQSVTLFDVYKGPGIEAGKKSLAFKIILQDSQKTLTDVEVDTVVEQLIAAVREKYDATLRI
jgi:phenylalanyl-tRNA synthetase beta chain